MQSGVVMHQIESQPLDSITSLETVEESLQVALSSSEAEYQVMRAAVQEIIFLRELLDDCSFRRRNPVIAEVYPSCQSYVKTQFFIRSEHLSTILH